MASPCEACDQISDSCHQYLLRKIFWKDGRTEVKQYTPLPFRGAGVYCVDLILIRLAKCWNNFFSSKFCLWLYCENGKYMIILWKCQVGIYFFLLSSQIFFYKIQNIFLGKNNIKLKLNSLRGKLIKKFARPKWFSHIPTEKRNKTMVIRKSHEKIFPSKIRLFFISLNCICANYFTYNELYFFFK